MVINGTISDQASTVLSKYIAPIILPHIKIWDYQKLAEEINKYSKESFLDNLEPALNTYIQSQIKVLSDISASNDVFDLKLDDINEIFINVQTTYSKELRKINTYVSFDNKMDKFKEEDVEGSKEIKRGLNIGYALAFDRGDLLKNNTGVLLKISKAFIR